MANDECRSGRGGKRGKLTALNFLRLTAYSTKDPLGSLGQHTKHIVYAFFGTIVAYAFVLEFLRLENSTNEDDDEEEEAEEEQRELMHA